MTDTMKGVLVMHLSLLHVLIEKIQDDIFECFLITFSKIALYLEIPSSELIVVIHYYKWHIANLIK